MAYLVQPADIELAVEWWRRRVSEMWADADSDDIYSNGTAYTETRDELDRVLLIARREFEDNVEKLLAGTITLAAWALITRVQIRIVHIVGAALAVGGFGVLRSAIGGKPPPDAPTGTQGAGVGSTSPNTPTGGAKSVNVADILQKVGAAIAREYKYFEKFVRQVLSAVNAAARAGMYAEAGRGTYEEARTEAMKASGKTEERRLLGIADHCSDCVAEANKGWQPIGTLRAIGDSICKSNCHCRKEFR